MQIRRIHELLAKLIRRSDSCRDLYPLQTLLQFLNLATSFEFSILLPDENLSGFTSSQLVAIHDRLDSWWHLPALTWTHLSRELLRLAPSQSPCVVHNSSPSLATAWSTLISTTQPTQRSLNAARTSLRL